MLIGQTRIKDLLNTYLANNTLPQFNILLGEKGIGKKTVTKYVVDKLYCQLYVPEELKVGDIRQIQSDTASLHTPKVYLLQDVENMTIQAQNALLKVLEEPPNNAYFIMTCTDLSELLPTIQSRSNVIKLDNYTKEELGNFTSDQRLLKVCNTPGMVKRMEGLDVDTLFNTCSKVVDYIGTISASNVFNILKHVDVDNLDLFINTLIYAFRVRLLEGVVSVGEIQTLYKYKSLLNNKSLNKKNVLECMFIELREEAKCRSQH